MSVTSGSVEVVGWHEVLAEFRYELANVLTLGMEPVEWHALERRCEEAWGASGVDFQHQELSAAVGPDGFSPRPGGGHDVILARGESQTLARIAPVLLHRAARFVCLELASDEAEGLARSLRPAGKLLLLSPNQLLLARESADLERIDAHRTSAFENPTLSERLTILTEVRSPPPSFKRRVRIGLRRVAQNAWAPAGGTGQADTRMQGPRARRAGLREGLDQVGQAYDWNPHVGTEGPFVHVVCSPAVLRQAIEQKRLGKIRKLMAGPNISALPNDDGGVSVAPEVDRILFASGWIQRWFESLDDSVAARSAIWPAGVDLRAWHPRADQTPSVDYLIYEKLNAWTVPIPEAHRALSQRIQASLTLRGLSFEVLRYGEFEQADYRKALGRCSAMIYLSLQETQSIAIAEAWASGLPVLVWSTGRAGWRGQYFEGASSCPYGDESTRLAFRDHAEFEASLDGFQARLVAGRFQPRAYVARELSVQASTRRYLDVWREFLARS